MFPSPPFPHTVIKNHAHKNRLKSNCLETNLIKSISQKRGKYVNNNNFNQNSSTLNISRFDKSTKLTFKNTTFSLFLSISSRWGLMKTQGPHHVAKKSMTTSLVPAAFSAAFRSSPSLIFWTMMSAFGETGGSRTGLFCYSMLLRFKFPKRNSLNLNFFTSIQKLRMQEILIKKAQLS